MNGGYLLLGLCICLVVTASYAEEDQFTPDPGTVILQTVPDVRQSTDFSCGASAFQAVLAYYGIDMSEGNVIEELNSSPENGTPPENILEGASLHGLKASLAENMTVEDLRSMIHNATPVIVAAQAWNGGYDADGNWITDVPDNWEDVWEDGHYMVVIGVDSKNVYFEDPSLIGTRGVIPIEEFTARWHDYQYQPELNNSKKIFSQLGIIITGKTPAEIPAYTRVT